MDAANSLKKYHDAEAARVRSYAKNAGMEAPAKYAKGGAVKSAKTNITIIVGKDQPQGGGLGGLAALAAAAKPKAPPVVVPPPAAPAGGPPGGMPGAGGIGGMPPMPGMKRGGRATALPMTAGAVSGPGREQKSASEAKKEGRAAVPTPRKKA